MALTAAPRNILNIKIQRVKTAYLAKRVNKDVSSDKTHEYIFKSDGNRTKTKEQKEKIAKIILENETVKGNFNDTDKRTSLAEIISAFEQEKYNKGDCLNISLLKSEVSFEKQKTANLGDELYVVIQTENMPDRKIKMNLKQGDSKVLTDVETAIFVTQEGSDTANILFTATVGEFAENNKNTITNASGFTDYAIAKITLKSTNEEDNKEYAKALKNAKDKKANLYIVMDAEPANNDWASVQYEEIFNNRPNLWYYGSGEWFEIRKSKIYKKGDKGDVVQEINIRLAGFGGNVPSENFTKRTEKTVIQFQKDYMKINPTGEVDEKTLKAIDEFSDKYPIPFTQTKCNCGECTGYGNEKFSSQKQKSNIKERLRKYEYPGIHKTLLWTLKSTLFYLSNDDKTYNLKFGKISSGYRCHINNKNHSRSSTNHMGKALDIHFYKKNDSISSEKNCDIIRDSILIKRSGAQLRWGNSNKISLEPSTKDKIGKEFLATNWVHYDVRKFELEYLTDKFFIKTLINEKSLKDLINS